MSAFDLALAYRGSVFATALEGIRTLTIATIVPLTVLVIWAIASAQGWLPEQILPPPAYVWQNFLEMVRNGDLAPHASISAIRVLVGFAIGASLGLLLGIAMGLSEAVDDYVRPLFTAIAQVPTLGWIPLLMLFLGIGEALKIVIIAKAAFIPMVLNTAAGIRGIPPRSRGCSGSRDGNCCAVWCCRSRCRRSSPASATA